MDTAEAGEALDRGYSTPVFAPMDVSLHDENADKLSYFKLLKEALLRAYKGTAGGKQPNTLLIGQGKRVLTAGTVTSIGSAEYILHWKQCVAIEKVGIVHNVQRVNSNDLKTHDGVSEDEVLARLTCNERRTGGVMRLERDRLVMPSDVDVKAMSALNWQSWMFLNRLLPANADAQDIKQAIAHTIYCLETQGWIPDYSDMGTGNLNLAIRSLVLSTKGEQGTIPVPHWLIYSGNFNIDNVVLTKKSPNYGIRLGLRKKGD